VIWSPAEMALVGYVSWEEVNVSSDKGRREVKYYLKKRRWNRSGYYRERKELEAHVLLFCN